MVLEGLTLQGAHRELLEKLGTLSATDFAPQPAVSGIAPERVRFFLDPDTGHHYLAVEAEAGRPQRIRFTLAEGLAARGLYPAEAPYDFASEGKSGDLTLAGQHPYYLFELTSKATRTPHSRLLVEGSEIVDPYEIVVKNQAFQKREAEKVTNLVVNEKVYTLAQRPRSRPITREYRVFHRRGQPTDYIFTGLAINGVPFPRNKLRQGFVFDADQVLLDPLAVELDRTYEYTYLGSETLAGHPTWKIGFRPTREGAYLAGTVWIDQETHAHRKLKAKQSGTLEPLVNREFTVTYDWVEQQGERYWTWSHNEGTAILSYLGYHQPVHVEIERSGHWFNSEGADHEIEAAYASNAQMLRETPEGLRWLTRRKVKKRGESKRGESTRHLDRERDSVVRTGAYERVLADRNHISHNRRVGLVYVYDPSFGDENPYTNVDFSFFDLSFVGSKLQVYLLARDDSFLSLAYPGIGRKNWVLSLDIEAPFDFYDRELGRPAEELVFEQPAAVLALSMPLSPALSVYARYRVSDVSFHSLGGTDESFVLPSDHIESTARVEVKLDRRSFSSELVLEHGERSEWEPWGLAAGEPLEPSFFKGVLRGGYYRRLSRNQSLGFFASYLRGSGLDRFSRIRLGFGGFRVAGYSRQVRFDEGFGVHFNYSGHFLKLFPLQLRLDWATIRPNDDLDLDSEYFAGVELVTTLHGPWKTDLFLSFGRGIATSLEDAEDEGTRFVASLSRRF